MLNAQKARMLNNQNLAGCTFCTLRNVQQPIKEKSYHFFCDCLPVFSTVESYFSTFFNNQNVWSKKWQLIGAPPFFNNAEAMILNIEIMTINLFIWNCKKLNTLPTLDNLNYHINYYREIFLFSKRYKEAWGAWQRGRPLNNP